MPTAQKRTAQTVGLFFETSSSGFSTFQLNGASANLNQLALGFVPAESKTLDAVRVFLSGTAGSPAASDIKCGIFADSANVGPTGAALAEVNCSATPSSSAWNDWTGLNLAVTAGTQYWAVFRNANASPGTNNVTIRYNSSSSQGNIWALGSVVGYGWCKRQSTDTGSTWATSSAGRLVGMRIRYDDGTYDGLPYSATTASAAGNRAYDTNEAGFRFTVPTNMKANIFGFAISMNKTGSPSGGVRGRIYLNSSTSPSATSYTIPAGNITTAGQMVFFYFSSAVQVVAGDVVRLVIGCAATGDTSSNAYQCQEVTIDSDSNSLALAPWSQQFCRLSGGAWTDTTTIQQCGLAFLDNSGEFNGGGLAANPLGGFLV
jgi:hypothetical protein